MAFSVEFCLELAHFSRKWLGSIFMISWVVCLEFFSQIDNFKSLEKKSEKWGIWDSLESLLFAVFVGGLCLTSMVRMSPIGTSSNSLDTSSWTNSVSKMGSCCMSVAFFAGETIGLFIDVAKEASPPNRFSKPAKTFHVDCMDVSGVCTDSKKLSKKAWYGGETSLVVGLRTK